MVPFYSLLPDELPEFAKNTEMGKDHTSVKLNLIYQILTFYGSNDNFSCKYKKPTNTYISKLIKEKKYQPTFQDSLEILASLVYYENPN